MASKIRKPKKDSGRGDRAARAAGAGRTGRAPNSDHNGDAAKLARELARAKKRIAELERDRARVVEKIDLAIKSIHKILKSQN